MTDISNSPTTPKRGVLALLALLALVACGDDSSTEGDGNDGNDDDGALYVFVAQVEAPDSSSTFVALTSGIPDDVLDLDDAIEVPGYGGAFAFEEKVYVTSSETFEVTRYRVEGSELVAEDTLSFQSRGLGWLGEPYFVDAAHAYFVNGDQYEIIEWNPQEMRIVDEHDISAIEVDGWGSEYRGGFMRESDGKLFVYWAYNNNREEFLNDFVLGVFDTSDDSFKVLEDPDCPSSAGFGGFFDEAGDLYLIADSFGGFTFFGSDEPKDACVLRIKEGEDELDESYQFAVTEALGNGLAPWGFYYAGDGIAYTTAVDPDALPDYDSVFEFIFAPVHKGYALDIRDRTAVEIENMPPDAVGFESVTVDGEVLIPRSTADSEIYDVENIQTSVYTLSDDGSEAELRFGMPGYLNNAFRLR